MVGLILLVALLLTAAEIGVLNDRLRRHSLAGGLSVVLTALVIWQLATKVAGLERLGWTNVDVEAGRPGQVLVVAVLTSLLTAAALHMFRRAAQSKTFTWVAASLGVIGVAGSVTTALTCFVE